MAKVELKHIDKIYDNNVQAVFDFNLDIKDKEFIVFVGPSGCGKSTTLRMIAGLEEITDGELFIDDVYSNDLAPKDRDIAMVFQNYALYPHMSVYDNMAFGLKNRHVPREEIHKRVMEAAEILGLTEYLDRKPRAMSGGQCQRVALGRAIVRHAKVFLMDEPLSNLDAKLRVQMRSQIIKIHERIGSITIYVTHDQIEAMTMADRIVVMNKGYIQQIGTPREIYLHPSNMFVAGFIGTPQMNFLDCTCDGKTVTVGDNNIRLNDEQAAKVSEHIDEPLVLGIRPADIHISLKKEKDMIPARVDVRELLGNNQIIHTYLNNVEIQVDVSAKLELEHNDTIYLDIQTDYLHLFNKDTGKAIF